MCDFKDKVVIVTGASSGIGRTTAVQFAEKGAKLVLVGRNKENLAATQKECVKFTKSENVLLVIADLTKLDDLKRIVDETVKAFKQIDVLVNNGGAGKINSIASMTPEVFEEMMNLNARAPLFLIKHSAPHLEKTKGSVVIVSSVGSLRGQPHYAAYSMAKAAVDQLARSASAEYAPKGIRVNAVNPGMIETNFSSGTGMKPEAHDAFAQLYAKRAPAGRSGKPEEIASVILFLASDKASYIHGVTLVADGGVAQVFS